ncbi:hypothetical protein BDY19DRAFT_949204 [Irpex rosettiformis]|uniref:Uncharacterized protein n=1 Tax=Irpex rosettiformis TaxID=378272 RepID=A0ACB8U333_9APHY|nr:hypothetical protein BDY19DRAFT_949204 [Irpex rosettiformis]
MTAEVYVQSPVEALPTFPSAFAQTEPSLHETRPYHKRNRLSSFLRGLKHNVVQPKADKKLATAYAALNYIYCEIENIRTRHAPQIQVQEQALKGRKRYTKLDVIADECIVYDAQYRNLKTRLDAYRSWSLGSTPEGEELHREICVLYNTIATLKETFAQTEGSIFSQPRRSPYSGIRGHSTYRAQDV